MSTALILIDLQHGLCAQEGIASAGLADLVDSSSVLDQASTLLEAHRANGDRVVHVRLGFEEGHLNRTNRTPRFDSHQEAGRFSLGSKDTEFCPEVAPNEHESIVTKGSVSSFASTSLETSLRAAGVDHIVLAGVATHLAIESTAREAADRGFSVTVVGDACIGPLEQHEHSLAKVLPGFANVTSLEEHLAA